MSSSTVSAVGASHVAGLGGSTPTFQFLRTLTTPQAFPSSISAGLQSSDPVTQRDALAQLQTFIYNLFFIPFDAHFLASLVVTAGIIILLLMIGIPVVFHRIYHNRFSLFRIERRAQGLYIVPNAINCFLIFEGIYGVIMIAFNFITWQLFSKHHAAYVNQWQAWRSLSWIPLYIGAFLTGWGSFYTAPGALDKPTAARSKTNARGALPWPLIINIVCLGTPFLLVASLVPFIALSQRQLSSAFRSYQTWDQQLNQLLDSPTSNLVSSDTVTMVSDQARSIWQSWSKSYWYNDISYALWSFWAILFLFFYIPAGGTLVFLLLRQVRRQRAILISYQRKLEQQLQLMEKQRGQPQHSADMDGQNRERSNHSRASRKSAATGSASGKPSHEMVGLEAALREFEPESFQYNVLPPSGQVTRTQPTLPEIQMHNQNGDLSSTAVPDEGMSLPVSPRSISMFKRLMRFDTAEGSGNSRGDKRRASRSKRLSIGGSPMIRYKYLRRCLVNLMILYFGIITAACCFLVSTIRLAAYEYERSLQGVDGLRDNIRVAGLLAAYASCIFGALTVGSIIFRNFDVPAPETSQPTDPSLPRGRKRLQRKGGDVEAVADQPGSGNAGRTTGLDGAQHPASRTLPAVPESVGVETSMMSLSRLGGPEPAKGTMRFSLSPRTGKGGTLVLQPDDHLASMVSGHTPEMEEGGLGFGPTSTTPSVSERFKQSFLFGKAKTKIGQQGPSGSIPIEREPTMSLPQDETESFGLFSMPTGFDVVPPRNELVSKPPNRSEAHDGDKAQAWTEDLTESKVQGEQTYEGSAAVGTYDSNTLALGRSTLKDGKRTTEGKRGLALRTADLAPAANPLVQMNSSTTLGDGGDSMSSPKVVKRRPSRKEPSEVGSRSPETPASKIARDWALSQYMDTPLPETPSLNEKQTETELAPSNSTAHPLSLTPKSSRRPRNDSQSELRTMPQASPQRPSNRVSPGTFF